MSSLNFGIAGGSNMKLNGGNKGSNIKMYSNGKVVSDGDVQYSGGGHVEVGGELLNLGKIKIFDDGTLKVQKDLINTGDILINDPERIKQIIVDTVKTAKNLTEIGSKIVNIFFGK